MHLNKNKNALITGVSTGIGKGIAMKLLSEGFTVFGSVRKEEDALTLTHMSPEHFVPLVFDVTNEKSVNESVEVVKKRLAGKGLDVFINNAGIAFGGPLLFMDSALIRRHFDVNVFGVINCIRAYAPLLGAVKDYSNAPGRIINVSSVSGKIGSPFVAPYVGSKHALEGISQSLRRELLPFGIDVIILRPGVVKTPIWEKARGKSDFRNTPYESILKEYGKQVGSNLPNGLEVEKVADLAYRIIEKKKPKTGYTISPNPVKTWLALHILSDRMLDKIFAKRFKM